MSDHYKGVPKWRNAKLDSKSKLRVPDLVQPTNGEDIVAQDVSVSGTLVVRERVDINVFSEPTDNGMAGSFFVDSDGLAYYKAPDTTIYDLTASGTSSVGIAGESVWVATATTSGSSYPTSGVEYIPMRVGQGDSIEFQLVSQTSPTMTFDVVYAMSAADGGDIDLQLDSIVVGDGDDPNGSLSSGPSTTFVPGNDTNAHIASSDNFNVSVSKGDVVRCKLTRPATDTHTGDCRVIDIRAKKA